MSRPPNEIAIQNNSALDPRIVKLTIEVNGRVKTYQDLFISAVGVKYANPLQDEAEITIYNLDAETQNYILTETSPYNANQSPKTVTLEAGRESYGTTVIYKGNIIYSSVTQPPDVGVILRCLTGNYLKTQTLARYQPATTTLSQIASAMAQDLNTTLLFQATDKPIVNYSYTGAALQQLELLAAMGQLNVYIDGDILVVKNAGEPIRGTLTQLSASTGMIGIPEFTERGVRVKFFVDNKTKIGGGISIVSEIYPAVNGIYVIYQLAFQITNRLTPFYYIADCARIGNISEVSTSG
jgi:hypothetical protein